MKRSFVANLFFLLLVNLLVKPFYIFGIDRNVQIAAGQEAFGQYASLYSFAFLFYILLDLGVTQYNTRHVSQDAARFEAQLSDFFSAKVLLALAYVAAVMLAGWLLGYAGAQLWMLLALCVLHVQVSFLLFFRANVAALQHFRSDALLSILDRLLLIGIMGGFIWGLRQVDVPRFIFGQLLANGLSAALAFGMVWHYGGRLRWRWDGAVLRGVLQKSYPYALLFLLMTIYNRIDFVMLERLLPDEGHEAGIYAAAYRVPSALIMMGLLFSNILLPLFARLLAERAEVQGLAFTAFRIIMVMMMTAAAGLFFFRHELTALLYPAEGYDRSALVLGLLGASVVAVSSNYIFGTLLTANGDLRLLNGIAFAGVLCNVCLNALLIPKQGAVGAAWATLFTQVLSALAHIAAARRQGLARMGGGLMAALGGFAGLLCLGAWLWRGSALAWPWAFAGLCATGGLAALLLGLFRWRDVRELLGRGVGA